MHKNLGLQFIFEIITGFCLVGIVLFFWSKPLWTSLLLSGVLAMQLGFWREKTDAVIMVSAALLGTPSEMIAVKLGIWTYRAPGLILGVPIWIPLIWAALFCFFRRITLTLCSAFSKLWPEKTAPLRAAFFNILGAVIVLYFFILIPLISKKIIMVYALIFIPAAIFWHGDRDRVIFVVGAIIGTFGEYICIRLGFWNYQYPVLKSIGLPVSLPMAWGLSAVINGRIAMVFEKESPRSSRES